MARKTAEALLTGSTPIVGQVYRPEMLRLAPPLHNCEDEVQYSCLQRNKIIL